MFSCIAELGFILKTKQQQSIVRNLPRDIIQSQNLKA